MSPEVSIVLPVYNGRRYLHESIQSVLDQNYEHFELVICDDASTDDSVSLARQFSDSRIRILRNDVNLGLFPTLNRAVRVSHGQYVKLWAQDDIMKSTCIATHVQFHQEHNHIGMSFSSRDTIDPSGQLVAIGDAGYPLIIAPEVATRLLFYYGSLPGNISTVMLDRKALEAVGLFREDMTFAGDFERWIAISRQYSIGFIRESLIYLRNHDEQLSRDRQHYVTWVQEGSELFNELLARLPSSEQAYAIRFRRRQVHRQYAHYMVRCLLSGNVAGGASTWKVIRKYDNPARVLALWLMTGNGRWFSLPPVINHK